MDEFADPANAEDLVDESYGWETADWTPDPAEVASVVLNELEGATVRARESTADQYRLIAELLTEAEADPDPWVGPDPTLDPGWVDRRNRTAGMVRQDRRDFAVRSAAADVATRLQLSENTVRRIGYDGQMLRARCPEVWSLFLRGQVPELNARTVADMASSLPEDTVVWAEFDSQIVEAARRLPAGRFRMRARAVRERVHSESIATRHERARQDRDVWVSPELDGMARLTALMPATEAYTLYNRADHTARQLLGRDGETRTLAQLRADVLADLVPNTEDKGKGAPVGIAVPVLTLLGRGDQPATLHGYGPIDPDTARRLAGEASSWVRILTHPVTGTVLDVDRTTYRVPKALRRWLEATHPTCVFPGCNRRSAECDIDHELDWQFGGTTSSDNLSPKCKSHHRVKHETKWREVRDPETGELWWISPTGQKVEPDPPPF